ncbi:MOSC domain-containing protein [Marinobacter sediminum]|uniref:MOSC domain-containing protein n=1 Tax=Marinobacter sediminum TaxID=256323 RepID=UPI002030D028|nr:MOSC domain-containing protein [Marinobacter sediminum]MCM0613026.1 MOSC domain-containing protein [Marinobacter sediminum]
MIEIGTVSSVWRYPVKGMAGESLTKADIGSMGVSGDRILAVQDVARQEIQSCKFRPELLQCRCKAIDSQGTVEILFPDGDVRLSSDRDVDDKISQLVGHQSKLQSLRPKSDPEFYQRFKRDEHSWLAELKATFEREPGEPLPDLDNLPEEMQTYVSLLGSFFLVSPFHMITTASLNHMRSVHTGSDWNIERFRPNLMIDTLPEISGLAEQEWLGRSLVIGDVTVKLSEGAPRCGAVVRKQQGFTEDRTILRSIVRDADQNLGVYGDVVTGGTIHAGDVIYLV